MTEFGNLSYPEQLVKLEVNKSKMDKCLFRLKIALELLAETGNHQAAIESMNWAVSRMLRDSKKTYEVARAMDKIIQWSGMAHSESESPIPNPVKTD